MPLYKYFALVLGVTHLELAVSIVSLFDTMGQSVVNRPIWEFFQKSQLGRQTWSQYVLPMAVSLCLISSFSGVVPELRPIKGGTDTLERQPYRWSIGHIWAQHIIMGFYRCHIIEISMDRSCVKFQVPSTTSTPVASGRSPGAGVSAGLYLVVL